MQTMGLSFLYHNKSYAAILTYAGDWYCVQVLNETLNERLGKHNIFSKYKDRWFRESINTDVDDLLDAIIQALVRHDRVLRPCFQGN